MPSLNSKAGENETSSAKKLFGHKLKATLPSFITSTQSTAAKNNTVTLEQQREFKPTKKTFATKKVSLRVKIITHNCTIF